MNRPPALRTDGLGLIELLVGLAISALVLASLWPMQQTASAAARVTGDQTTLERDADFALERIAARVRATTAPAVLPAASASWFAPVSYVLSNGTLVERQANTPDLALADSVTDFQLAAPTVVGGRQLIQVSLTLAHGDATVSANATVRMGGMQ